MEGRKYWKEEKKIRCRLCEGETVSWEHVWKGCREWREGGGTRQEAFEWILGEKGEEERWMREVEEERRR